MKLFLCDPQKNTVCAKNNCHFRNTERDCKYTSREEFAKLDEDGNPIKIKAVWDEKNVTILFQKFKSYVADFGDIANNLI